MFLATLNEAILEKIRNNDSKLDSKLEIETISLIELASLSDALTKNSNIVSLKINKLEIDLKDEKIESHIITAVEKFSNLIRDNNTLGKIAIKGIPASFDATPIIEALQKNSNLRSFDLDQIKNKKINDYLERNRQLLVAATLLIEEFFLYALQEKVSSEILKSVFPINKTIMNAFKGDLTVNLHALIEQGTKIVLVFENDVLREELQGVITKINDFVNSALEFEMSPLHLAAHYGLIQFIPDLINLGISPEIKDMDLRTPLHMAARTGELEAVKLLIEKYHVNIHSKTINEETPLDLAVQQNQKQLLEYLQQKVKSLNQVETKGKVIEEKKIDIEEVVAGRRFFQIFGGKKLAEKVPTKGTLLHAEGGLTDYEGYETLVHYLDKFSKEYKFDSSSASTLRKNLSSILTNLKGVLRPTDSGTTETRNSIIKAISQDLKDAEKNKQAVISSLKEAKPGDRKILLAGCLGHAVGASIEKISNDKYILNIADRGYFSDKFTEYSGGKRASVKSISFDSAKLKSVIEKMFECQDASLEKAGQILFNEIPKMVHAEYKENPHIVQSTFKSGICYFANPKTILYDEFVSELGAGLGKRIYKQFSLFMREKVVEDYEKFVGDKDLFVQAGKEIVSKKKEKYASIFSEQKNENLEVTQATTKNPKPGSVGGR